MFSSFKTFERNTTENRMKGVNDTRNLTYPEFDLTPFSRPPFRRVIGEVEAPMLEIF